MRVHIYHISEYIKIILQLIKWNLDKAKCFFDQFASVFTKINITTLSDNNNNFSVEQINHLIISP